MSGDNGKPAQEEQASLASRGRSGARLRRLATYAFAALAVGMLVFAVVNQWEDFTAALGRLHATTILAAFLASAASVFVGMLCWRESIAATTGLRLPIGPAARTLFVSALGKYVPGAIWPTVAQMELLRKYDVPRVHSALGSLLAMGIGLVGAIVSGTAGVLIAGGNIEGYWWLLPIAVAGSVFLIPAVLRGAIRLLARLHPRLASFGEVPIDGRAMGRAFAFVMAAAPLIGLASWLVVRDISPETGNTAAAFWFTLGAIQLAAAVGLVVIIAPGGIGAREAVLIAMLSTVVTRSEALALAAISRALLMAVDILGAIIAVLLWRLLARPKKPLDESTQDSSQSPL